MKKGETVILSQTSSEDVKLLLKYYEEDKQKAKIYSRIVDTLEYHQVIKVGTVKGFAIKSQRVKYGISKNSILYRRYKTVWAIFLNPKTCYTKNGIKIKQTTISDITYLDKSVENAIKEYYPWIRNFTEESINGVNIKNKCAGFCINWIIRNKCFNLFDALRKLYDLPRDVAFDLFSIGISKKTYNIYKDHLICNKVNPEFKDKKSNHMLEDVFNMAYKLDRKVNMGWSVKRMKQEHDAMSAEITRLRLAMNDRPLAIRRPFLEFSEKYEVPILRTTTELAKEGQFMQHCVASYTSHVDIGRSGIYRLGGHTIELIISEDGKLKINQVRGKRNSMAPQELVDDLTQRVNNYNKKYSESNKIHTHIPYGEVTRIFPREIDEPFQDL